MSVERRRHPLSDYQEFRPGGSLDGWLACLWSQTIGAGEGEFAQRVLPDGCVDIIWIHDSPPRVVGPATKTFIERLGPGTAIVAIRFRPGAAAAVLGLPVNELRDMQLPLQAVWGKRATQRLELVADALHVPAKLEAVENGMREHLASWPQPDPIVAALIRLVEQRCDVPVRELTRTIGISERQLRRRFRHAVGYGIKTFQRITRLRRLRALAVATGSRVLRLARLAYELGYADQAHMTREIKALAGIPPAILVRLIPGIQTRSDQFSE